MTSTAICPTVYLSNKHTP